MNNQINAGLDEETKKQFNIGAFYCGWLWVFFNFKNLFLKLISFLMFLATDITPPLLLIFIIMAMTNNINEKLKNNDFIPFVAFVFVIVGNPILTFITRIILGKYSNRWAQNSNNSTVYKENQLKWEKSGKIYFTILLSAIIIFALTWIFGMLTLNGYKTN